MTKDYIFASFRDLSTAQEKLEYIQSLESLKLPYDFNYTNLIAAWEKKAKKEAEVEVD
jgi:hypothetical protein